MQIAVIILNSLNSSQLQLNMKIHYLKFFRQYKYFYKPISPDLQTLVTRQNENIKKFTQLMNIR